MSLKTLGRSMLAAVKGARSAMSTQYQLDQGELWPQEPALSRYRQYRQWQKIFEGCHQELWDPYRKADEAPYVTLNVSASLSQTLVDRLWGQPPIPSVVQDEQPTVMAEGEVDVAAPVATDPRADMLAAIWEASRLDQEGKLAIETRSWSGDGVLKVFYDSAEDEVRVTVLDPESFDATFDPLDAAKMTEAVFATVLPGETQEHDWLFEEVHTLPVGEDGTKRGLIENRLWMLTASAISGAAADQHLRKRVAWDKRPEALAHLEEFVETGIDVLPVVLIPNRKTACSRPWGRSDYCDSEAIQRQLNRRLTETNSILDKTEESILTGDISLFEDTGEGQVFSYYNHKAIPLQQGEDPPQFVVYPGTTAEGQQEADTLKRDFARVSRVNPESMGLIDAALPPSGRAIKLMQVNTTSTVDGHRLVIDPALREILSAATKLYAAWVEGGSAGGWLEPDEIALEWSEGLPEDMLENVQLASQIKLSGLPVQDWRLIQIMFPDMTQEECEAEVAAYDEKSQAAMEASFGAAQETAGGSTEIGEGDLEETVAAQEGRA